MNDWNETFRHRLRDFETHNKSKEGTVPLSIKIRVTGGCFHRQHSPRAYEIIDRELRDFQGKENIVFDEHESGPELLVFVAAATAGISLAKSIIDLIVAVIKARSEGIKKGDYPLEPLELIVRRTKKDGEYAEEIVLRVGYKDFITEELVEKQLNNALSSLLKDDDEGKS